MSGCSAPLPLAQALRMIRQKRGLSQGQVAKRLGISRSMITRYENDACAISGTRLGDLATVLRVDPGLFYRLTLESDELQALAPFPRLHSRRPPVNGAGGGR